MLTSRRNEQFYLIGVREQALSDECSQITFFTTRGDLVAYSRVCHGMRQAVIMLGGNEHGFDSSFDRLGRELAELGIGSVRIDHRLPGDCAQCAIDTLLVCQYLDDEGISDVALVGWSFGADVALAAGSVARVVRGVAAISPCDVPEVCVRRMGTKPLLLMHGEADDTCSIENAGRVSLRAGGLADIIAYPGAGHDLAGVRSQATSDLVGWIVHAFDPVRSGGQTGSVGAAFDPVLRL